MLLIAEPMSNVKTRKSISNVKLPGHRPGLPGKEISF
jgi:hypothetical protein